MNTWTASELVELIRYMVSRFPSAKAAAQHWKISEAYLSDVLSGRRAPGKKICNAVGFTPVIMYKNMTNDEPYILTETRNEIVSPFVRTESIDLATQADDNY